MTRSRARALINTIVTLAVVFVVMPRTIIAQVSSDDVLARLNARIAANTGAQVGIAVREIGTNRALAVNGDSVFHAASTMKVPVLFALFREFERGKLKADQTLVLKNQFKSIVDGSAYSLDSKEDSDSTVYALVGTPVPLRDLANRMITHSSNLATNALIELLDAPSITRLTRDLGASRMMVRRGVEDDLAYQAGLNNTTTANDLVALFSALEGGKVAGSKSTAEMLAILEAQAFNDEIPAGLPPGTRVAHKTGSITATYHDAGIVYPRNGKPYAIAILTRGIADGAAAKTLIADCSRVIWEWLQVTR